MLNPKRSLEDELTHNQPDNKEQMDRRRPNGHKFYVGLGYLNLLIILVVAFFIVRFVIIPRFLPKVSASLQLPGAAQPTHAVPLPSTTPGTSFAVQTAEPSATVAGVGFHEGEEDAVTITPAPTLALVTPPANASITPAPTLGLPETPVEESGEYVPQSGSPFYIRAASAAESRTCDWSGIAGQVFNARGEPVPQITVSVQGYLGESEISLSAISGSALTYGPAGYEIQISPKPLYTERTLSVQLLDAQGSPLSPKVYFDTYESCDKNLAIVNFMQSAP